MSEAQSSSEESEDVSSSSLTCRNLDVASPASVDLVALNNKVVSMRATVKRVKIQVIHKMTRHIETLKKKRGSEKQIEKNRRKGERLLEEVQIIKDLKPDKIAKYSLAHTDSFSDISKQPDVSVESRALARLAEHKLLSDSVKSFRRDHEDWKSLAAFLISRNSGRRFKKKKPNTVDKIITNVRAGEVMVKSYLEKRLQGQNIPVGPILMSDEKEVEEEEKVPDFQRSDVPGRDLNDSANSCSDENSESENSDDTSIEKINKNVPCSDSDLGEVVPELTNVKPKSTAIRRNQMVIEKFNLDEDDNGLNKESVPNFLIAEDAQCKNPSSSKRTKTKKDSFFVTSDDSDADDEGDDKSDEAELSESSDDDSSNEERLGRGKSAFHSTFLGSLSEKKWRKSAEDRRKQKISADHSGNYRGRGRGFRGNTQNRGRGRPGGDTFRSNNRPFGRDGFRGQMYRGKEPGTHQQSDRRSHQQSDRSSHQQSDRSGHSRAHGTQKSYQEKKNTDPQPDTSTVLHPSWQASKKRKEQSKIQTFQGKKIKFDDDD